MKKEIIILMILCIMLCGCSKAANEPASTTSTTNTPTEVEKAEISHSETLGEYTIDGSCDICHKTKKLKEYRYETVAYAICEDCYNDTILGYEQDIEFYNDLVMIINLGLTNEDVIKATQNDTVLVTYNAFGVVSTNDVLYNYIKDNFDVDLTQPAKAGSYEITVKGFMVTKSKAPKHPLAK